MLTRTPFTWSSTAAMCTCEYSKPLLIELQLIWIEIWKILFTVENILQKTHDLYEGRWVTCLFEQNLTISSNLHYYYIKKQVQLLSLLSVNKYIIFSQFLNKDSVIFCYLLSSALYISLNCPFICVLSTFFILGLPFASLIQITA
jgi:hypothetical protein